MKSIFMIYQKKLNKNLNKQLKIIKMKYNNQKKQS